MPGSLRSRSTISDFEHFRVPDRHVRGGCEAEVGASRRWRSEVFFYGYPALPRWANEFRRSAADNEAHSTSGHMPAFQRREFSHW